MRLLAPLTFASLSFASVAGANAPERSPLPLLRPELQSTVASSGLAVSPSLALAAISPVTPVLRPEDQATPAVATRGISVLAVGSSLLPVVRPEGGAFGEGMDEAAGAELATISFRTKPQPKLRTKRSGGLCGDPSLQGEELAPIVGRVQGCGLVDGVRISSIDGIPLSQPATVDCKTALALRAWVTEGLRPAVGKTGGGVARIEVAGSYACRPRNNQRGQPVSEHGRGKAIDISGIILRDGRIVSVLKHWGKGREGKILTAMQLLACNTFGTVLGPAANRFHRDHFHFDTARKRGGVYCR
jgi:hypothetical protein